MFEFGENTVFRAARIERLHLGDKFALKRLIAHIARAHHRVRPKGDDGIVDKLPGTPFGITDDFRQVLRETLRPVSVNLGGSEMARKKRSNTLCLIARNILL